MDFGSFWDLGFWGFLGFFGIFWILGDFLGLLACSRKDLPFPSIMLLKSLSMKNHIINGDGPPRGCGEVVGIFGLFKEGIARALAC